MNTMMTSICSISRQFGVPLTLQHTIKVFVFMLIIDRISEGSLQFIIMIPFPAKIGKALTIF